MESVVNSRQPNKVNSRQPNKVAVTLSKQINNGGLSAKTLYDDVYGGPPKFGVSSLSPRFEDYSEIFGSFHTPRASSIPVLDLPVVDETEIFFDPRSAAFNYTEVFGACSGLDFAVSFDDLFHQPNGRDGVSSEEAWTPAETDSFSGESDHSGNNQSISNGDLFQPVGGSTEFNISYHKVNGTSNEDMAKGKTHVTQLHAVPGCTVVYDETTRLHRTDPSFQVADDIDLNMQFNAQMMGNHLRKTKSHLHNFTSGEQTIASDLNLHNGFGRNGSHSSEMFLTVSDINLRSMPSQVPPPSRPPPVLDAKKGDTSAFYSNSERAACEETPGDSPPPFFDVEVDVNSSPAAIKEAMHRAEAKLRSAKELKERKQGVYEGSVKSSYDVKNNEAKMNENMIRLSSLKDETMRCTKTKVSLTNERKAAPETLKTLEGKGVLKKFEEKKMKESMSSQELDRSTGVGTWNEETEFFELVGTDETGKVIQPTKHTKSLLQDTRNHEHGWKEREASNVQQEYKKVKAIEENYQVEEDKKKCKAAEEAYEHDKNIRRSKSSNVECRHREHVKKERVAEIFEQEENEKNIRMAHQRGKTEKKVTEADQSESLENVYEMRHKEHKQVEMKKPKEFDRQTQSEVSLGVKLNENEKKLKEVENQQQSVKRHMQSEKMKENGKVEREAFALGQVESKEKLKDSVEMEDFDERSKEAFKQDNTEEKETCRREKEMRLKQTKQIQNKKGLKEAHEREEIEKRQGSKKEGSDEGLKHSLRWEENEKRLKEDFDLEVNERRGNDEKEAFEQRESYKREKEAYEMDQNKWKFKEVSHGYGEGNRFQEGGDNEGIQKVLNLASEKERNSGVLNEVQIKRQIESPSNQAFNREGNENVSNEDSHPEQSEYIVKDVGRKEEDKGVNKALDQMEGNEEGEKMDFTKETDVIWEMESDENLLAAQSASIHEESIAKLEVSQESVADHEIGNTRTECRAGENKLEEVMVENRLANEKIRAPEMILGDAEHSGTQLGKLDDSMTEVDDRRSTEAAEPATVQEAVNVQKTAQWFHVGQSTERKEKSLNETSATIVKDAERMRRERELEKDRLRKIEEERDREREREKDRRAVDKAMLEAEREREREKDRMAVDRAAFEACDRAYAEARERAERAAFERATVEAQQRALAEARERLEKACAEARDESYVDKAATEARWKAEHAAIERATAEAQERAMEKLKVERAAFESRERLERSVSDKFGVCYRNGGRQGYSSSDMLDPQFQNSSSSAGSRYTYSSVYGTSSFSERSVREGESAQRCRARLERYRRTAERAAKALAEKNMRDLLAQKEQAERNRLAETLDAEVKRWSSGKEGNLRALLSTLQYILGPDSGWQPIPLTEVITSAAVKKAYRKATLCVHPDKLQQRGANIPHKYICGKVFDLLKDAWNKFNSEER